jgi:D-isomer specific 2-hydroxyacid dehydrogenase, NAD binding domain
VLGSRGHALGVLAAGCRKSARSGFYRGHDDTSRLNSLDHIVYIMGRAQFDHAGFFFRGAALDVMVEEPLSAASPLWAMDNVLITPHTAGETCRYEDNVLAIMQENLARLWRGETELLNQVV